MPTTSSNLVNAFYDRNCLELTCWLDPIPLRQPSIAKLRDLMTGKRRNLPFTFAGFYGVERKDGIGVVAWVKRSKSNSFGTYIRWFRVGGGPPEQYGKFSDYLGTLSNAVGSREANIAAKFSYDLAKVGSLFTPIQMEAQGSIFDEIVGFKGIKRTSDGNRLYSLEVTLGTQRLEHDVGFSQTIQLSEELPLGLLDIAARISNLALKKKE